MKTIAKKFIPNAQLAILFAPKEQPLQLRMVTSNGEPVLQPHKPKETPPKPEVEV